MEVIINGVRFVPVNLRKEGTKQFHTLIKEARKSKKETIEEAAKNIGIAKSSLWELEQGGSLPSLGTLKSILDYYDIDFYDIKFD